MYITDPNPAGTQYFINKDGSLEAHLYDLTITDGNGTELVYKFGNNMEESLNELRKLYNFVLESNKI